MIRNRWTRMNKIRKRAFAVTLATAVVSTSLNIGSIAANAGTSARGRVIVAFEELPEDIADQTLPIGGSKSDINFPEDLEVLLYSEDSAKDDKKDGSRKGEEQTTQDDRGSSAGSGSENENEAVPGGNIKNCILNAAFLAAADPEAGGQVHMRHYLNAIKYEFVKVGKVFTKSDFEPYAEEVGLA